MRALPSKPKIKLKEKIAKKKKEKKRKSQMERKNNPKKFIILKFIKIKINLKIKKPKILHEIHELVN
jgi:hypothetical protein